MFKSIRYSVFRRVPVKFLYNSTFKPLASNTVVMTRVLCMKEWLWKEEKHYSETVRYVIQEVKTVKVAMALTTETIINRII